MGLPSRTASADPVHCFVAAKSGVVWKYVVDIVALIVPLSQAGRLSFSKCGLRLLASLACRTLWASSTCAGAHENGRLPFPLASWATPLNPRVADSQHLLWRLLIFAVVPILSYIRCYGSKRVVQADCPVSAVWTLCAIACSLLYTRCPDVWLPSRALVALLRSPDATIWLD